MKLIFIKLNISINYADTDKINKLIFDSAKKYDPPHSSPIPFTLGLGNNKLKMNKTMLVQLFCIALFWSILVGVENLGTTNETISDSDSSPDHVLNELQVPATTEYRNDNGGDNRDDSFTATPLQNCHPGIAHGFYNSFNMSYRQFVVHMYICR